MTDLKFIQLFGEFFLQQDLYGLVRPNTTIAFRYGWNNAEPLTWGNVSDDE